MPYEPRRPVPWNGIDVLMFLGIMFLAEIACLKIGMLGSGIHLPDEWDRDSIRNNSICR